MRLSPDEVIKRPPVLPFRHCSVSKSMVKYYGCGTSARCRPVLRPLFPILEIHRVDSRRTRCTLAS